MNNFSQLYFETKKNIINNVYNKSPYFMRKKNLITYCKNKGICCTNETQKKELIKKIKDKDLNDKTNLLFLLFLN